MRTAISITAMAVLTVGLAAGHAFAAGNNNSPPAGAILDLGGGETGTPAKAVNHGAPVTETVSFVAAIADTNITFAFREDPAFISFSNVSMVNATTGSPTNLIINGDFSGGQYADAGNSSGQTPNGWTYANVYGATASGYVTTCSAFGGNSCWYDGSVQAYDAITQVVPTTIGSTYTISFQYTDNSSLTTFSDLSTNGNTTGTGGNGIDILVYAQAGLPQACPPGQICTGPNPPSTSTPEPASILALGAGLAGLTFARRRRTS